MFILCTGVFGVDQSDRQTNTIPEDVAFMLDNPTSNGGQDEEDEQQLQE